MENNTLEFDLKRLGKAFFASACVFLIGSVICLDIPSEFFFEILMLDFLGYLCRHDALLLTNVAFIFVVFATWKLKKSGMNIYFGAFTILFLIGTILSWILFFNLLPSPLSYQMMVIPVSICFILAWLPLLKSIPDISQKIPSLQSAKALKGIKLVIISYMLKLAFSIIVLDFIPLETLLSIKIYRVIFVCYVVVFILGIGQVASAFKEVGRIQSVDAEEIRKEKSVHNATLSVFFSNMAFFAWFYNSLVSTVWMTSLLLALIGIVYGLKGLKGPLKRRAILGILIGLLLVAWWCTLLPWHINRWLKFGFFHVQ